MPKFTAQEVKALSTFSLEKALDAARTKYFDMDNTDATAVKVAKEIFEMFDAEMNRRHVASGLNQPSPTAVASGEKQSYSIEWRNMNDYMKDNVTTFQPGQEVTKFIHQLDNVFEFNVTSENKLEEAFCRMIPKRMCTDYQTNFIKSVPEAERLKFAKIKEHLLKTYQTQETIYQTMSHVWNCQQGPGEDILTLGVRMEEKCLEIFKQIETKFLKEQQANGKTEFDAKDAFLLMGSMLMIQHVQSKEPEAYRLMVRDIDDAFKPAEIARRAKSYIDRIGKSEPAAVNNGTFHSNQPSNQNKKAKKDTDCPYWKKNGKCRYKDAKSRPCLYRHLDKYKKDQKSKPQKAMHASGNTGATQTQNNPPPTPSQPAPTSTQPGPPPMVPHPYYNMPSYYPPGMNYGPPQANPAFNVVNARKHFEDVGYENLGQEVFHQN